VKVVEVKWLIEELTKALDAGVKGVNLVDMVELFGVGKEEVREVLKVYEEGGEE